MMSDDKITSFEYDRLWNEYRAHLKRKTKVEIRKDFDKGL